MIIPTYAELSEMSSKELLSVCIDFAVRLEKGANKAKRFQGAVRGALAKYAKADDPHGFMDLLYSAIYATPTKSQEDDYWANAILSGEKDYDTAKASVIQWVKDHKGIDASWILG